MTTDPAMWEQFVAHVEADKTKLVKAISPYDLEETCRQLALHRQRVDTLLAQRNEQIRILAAKPYRIPPSELASLTGISRQAVHQLTKEPSN